MNVPYLVRRIIATVATVIVGVAAPVVLMHSAPFEEKIETAAWFAVLPYVLMAVSCVLALCFRQARVSALALVWLGFSTRGAQHFYGFLPPFAQGDFVWVASLLMPIISLSLFLMIDRRALSARGLVCFYVAFSAVGILFWLPGLSSFHAKLLDLPSFMGGEYAPDNFNIPFLTGVILLVSCGVMLFVERPESPALGCMMAALVVLAVVSLHAPMNIWGDFEPPVVFRSMSLSAGILLIWTVLDGAWRHAYVDELTQLPGRRPMRHHFASLGDNYALAVIDVDHFKRVNDDYGHDVGDQVLRFVASSVRTVRGGAAYRFGGEEFVVVFGRRWADACDGLVEDLRQEIESREFALRSSARPARKPRKQSGRKSRLSKTIKVTVSAGVAWPTDETDDPDEVLGMADKALYRAKRGGRNRVCLADK